MQRKKMTIGLIGGGILLAVLAIVLIALFRFYPRQGPPPEQTAAIQITRDGFVPATLSIKKGTRVVWTNADNRDHIVASNPHPAHTGLEGLESKVLASGATYSFVFDQTGEFGYHDHLNPTHNGSVVVQD